MKNSNTRAMKRERRKMSRRKSEIAGHMNERNCHGLIKNCRLQALSHE
jgi:hypothetical protein